MPTLGEYLGGLLAEITNARLQADLESARIAQLYASHPLLQHMPVPRFRLPDVSLDLPVAVERIDPPPVTTPDPAELLALQRKIEGIVEQQMSQLKVLLAPNLQKRFTETLTGSFDSLRVSRGISVAEAIKVSEQSADAALEAIRAASKDPATLEPAFESSLRRQFAAEFLKLEPPPPRVQVLVVTAQLKEIAPPASLSRIHLTITEEGVEWTQTNPSDSSSKTLLPE